MIIEMLIKDYADTYSSDFNTLYESSETLAEAMVDWVDQSGDQYMTRLEIMRKYFPNFSY